MTEIATTPIPLTLLASLLVALPEASAVDVEVHTLDTPVQSGKLVSIQQGLVTITPAQPQAEPVDIPIHQVLQLDFPNAQAITSQPAIRVALRGGGLLQAQQILTQQRTAEITLDPDRILAIPIDQVASLLFGKVEETELAQWLRAAKSPRIADVLIAVRGDQRAELNGIFGDLGQERLQFNLDGEVVPVRRDRLFAMHFAGDQAPTLPIQVHDVHGNIWPANDVQSDNQTLTIDSIAAEPLVIPTAHIERIDFSRQRLDFLSDLEPVLTEHIPFFDIPYDVQKDRNFARTNIRIGNNEFRKGLVLHSKTTLTYELNGAYRRFLATAGIESSAGPRGDANAKILGDGAILWEARLKAGQPPVPVDLSLEGIRRLVLIVDFGALADIGDHVAFGDARLIK